MFFTVKGYLVSRIREHETNFTHTMRQRTLLFIITPLFLFSLLFSGYLYSEIQSLHDKTEANLRLTIGATQDIDNLTEWQRTIFDDGQFKCTTVITPSARMLVNNSVYATIPN